MVAGDAMWQLVRVHPIARPAGTLVLMALVSTAGCKDRPTAAEIAERGWRAHELVIAAGERAASCAEAGAAMQRAFAEHRADFVAAIALDRDRQRLAEATAYLEAHQDRYADLETRMTGLSERCAGDPAVQAVFGRMEAPDAP
jgi:hypothetical protein